MYFVKTPLREYSGLGVFATKMLSGKHWTSHSLHFSFFMCETGTIIRIIPSQGFL